MSRLKAVTKWEDVVPTLDDKCVAVLPWCEEEACEDDIKERSGKKSVLCLTTFLIACTDLSYSFFHPFLNLKC